MNTIKVIFLFVLSLNLVFTVNCGVKGRPLPPEFPPQIGHGVAETSSSYSQEEDLKPIQTEKTKTQVPDNAEVKASTTIESVNEKKSSVIPTKKQKKAKSGLKDKSTNLMDDKSSTSKVKSPTTIPVPNINEESKK